MRRWTRFCCSRLSARGNVQFLSGNPDHSEIEQIGLPEMEESHSNPAMNYLAHGFRFLDSPLMVAGTAVPDWLSVADRRVRVRSRRIHEHLDSLDADLRTIAEGMLQHLHDDDLFHRSVRFVMLEAELSLRFRRIMPDRFDHRPALLGHIVIELLLDDFIARQFSEVLDVYYAALSQVSELQIQEAVNAVATRTTDRLAGFVQQFRITKFLYDYADDTRLLGRLNQVMKRVTLPSLDSDCLPVLRDARQLLNEHGEELLHAVATEAVEPELSLRTETEISGARFHRARHVINVPHVQKTTVISAPVLTRENR